MSYTRLNPDTGNGIFSIANVSGIASGSFCEWARYGKAVTVTVYVTLSAGMSAWSSKTLATGMPNAVYDTSTILPLDNGTSQAKLNAMADGSIVLESRGSALSSGAVLYGSLTCVCQ